MSISEFIKIIFFWRKTISEIWVQSILKKIDRLEELKVIKLEIDLYPYFSKNNLFQNLKIVRFWNSLELIWLKIKRYENRLESIFFQKLVSSRN